MNTEKMRNIGLRKKGVFYKIFFVLILCLFFLSLNSPIFANDFGTIWGMCQDSTEKPLSQVVI
ncbi:MAG: hypothetical protein MUP98_16280, partial [Candidatus Aminicenantes bacterium]|nr:hypothetical protein [Candidatus Aminicenantes bacterium]